MHKKVLLFFSPISYDFIYQRPQALADTLAEEMEVYYFQLPRKKGSLNNNRPWLSFEHAVEQRSANLKIVKVSNYFKILNIPLRLSKTRMQKVVKHWIEEFIRKSIPADSSVYAFIETPLWWQYIRDVKFNRIFFDLIDDIDVLSHDCNKQTYVALLKELTSRSARIFVTAERLEQHLVKEQYKRPEDIIRLPNGVAYERFQTTVKEASVLALKEKYQAVIGYIGVIYHWIDTDLIAEMARRHPEWALVLVGPFQPEAVKELQSLPNIFLTGKKEHRELPGYLNSFDVCLNPFRMNEISANTNPVKLFEYLACGKPVVSTPIHELKNFENLVYSGSTHSEFILAVEQCLLNDANTETIQQIRRGFAARNSWQARTNEILKHINNQL